MIARKNRFHGHASVRGAYRRGKTARSSLGTLHYDVNPKRKTYRLAVVVSKKVNKSAVVRNRVRRRIFEIVRLQAGQFHEAYDLVLTVQTDQPATLPHDELSKQVDELLARAGIIHQA